MADHSALSPGLNQKKALKIAIPLPGMVEENVGTPFTEIDQTRTRGADQTPPKLPPRTTANNDRPDNSFFRPKRSQSQSHSLIPFSRGFSDQFPLHVKVTQGHYGTNHMETLSGQEELIILYEKRQEVLHVRSKIGKTYSIPFGSSIPISILHNPNDNEAEAVKGIAYESLSDLKKDQLPKVISCNSADKQSPVTQNEILLVKRLDTKNKKLCVHSILKTEDSATEKELDLNCKATFTTKPDAVALYLFDIVKYCNENSTTKMRALLDLDKLSSSNANTIKHMDRSLMEPVDMERKTEDSLVVVRAEPGGDYDNCQLFEIPLEENLPIEVEILEVPQDPLYSSLDPPDYRSKFDPKKLKVWDISRCEASQSIQQIFYSSLRSGHEMDGIDLPQRRYEKVKAPDHQHNVVQPIKVSVPVIPSTEEAVAVAPQLPPKPKPASAALASLTQLSPDLMMKQFQEMLQKAVKKEVGGQLATERMLSVSSDPESCDSLMSPNVIHQQTQAQKLTPDDLYQVITELIDCEGLWYCLGIYLGVPKPKIDEISTIHSYDPKRSLIEVVSYWLNNSLDASWLSIVKALIQSEKRNKAREIAEKFDAEIPSVDIQDTVPLELQGDLSHDEKIQLKKLSKGIEQKSEELQDVKRNTQKNKEKLDRLGQELAEVKRKLRFNEEYALVLANGSQINALKIKELRKSDAMTEQAESMAVRDKQSYERRIRNAQSETTRLQQQLLGIDREHKNVFSQQRVLHEKDSTLHQELLTMEEDLNQLVLGGHDPIDRNEESEETLESPEYYNIILKNGMMEQKMHQKEITQLQEELKIKEDQLISLQEKLSMTQQNLAKVEERLSSKYDYVTVMDTLVTDENLKTSLEADKVDYHLQIANVHFSKREVKSKLSLKEIKMQKSKKLNRIAQNKAHMTSGGNSGSQEDVFLPTPSTPCEEIEALDYDTAKPHAIKTTTTRQEASLAANRPKANFKPSTKAKLKPISQSLRARPPATKPVASRSRAATTDTKLREASSRKPPRNVDGEFRARLGATAKNLRGVEVLARTTIIVTNSPQTFHWVGYGFKLTIPQGSLPAGVDQCRLDIKASVAGQYQFPDNLKLISGVFWIGPLPLCRFQQQLTVEIQHCAKMTSSTKLSFVRADCSQESLPYKFKQLKGRGSFTDHSSYGSLELNHFSGLAVTGNDVEEREYIASLYYQQCDPPTLEIHFVITWDSEAHITAAQEYFKDLGAKERSHMQVEFKKHKITLSVPMNGVIIGKWNLIPTVSPCINQSTVDSFKPGRTIRSRRLKATLTQDLGVEVPACSYLVTLDGADEPNQMQIEIDAYRPSKGQDTSAVNQVPPSCALVAPSHGYPPPTSYPLLQSVPGFARGYNIYALPQIHQGYAPYTQAPHQWLQDCGDLITMTGRESGPVSAIECPVLNMDQLVHRVGIDEDLLKKECSEKSLKKIAPLLANWLMYAKALELTQSQIQDIDGHKLLSTNEMKTLLVLEKWHQLHAFNATYHHLINVCLSRGHATEATKICKIVKEDSF